MLHVDPADLAAQRAVGWPDIHPEDFCHRCGALNPSWFVDSDRFNAAVGIGWNGIVCVGCFVQLHEQATGLRCTWRLTPGTPFRPIEAMPEPLFTSHPDERVCPLCGHPMMPNGSACMCPPIESLIDPETATKLAALLAERHHVIQFGDDGWIISHPLSERLDGSLFDCPMHVHATPIDATEARQLTYIGTESSAMYSRSKGWIPTVFLTLDHVALTGELGNSVRLKLMLTMADVEHLLEHLQGAIAGAVADATYGPREGGDG